MARRRRTSGIQRRERASTEALNRRLDDRGSGVGLPDWRLLAIGGVLVGGAVVVVLVLLFGSGPSASVGTAHANAGQAHVAEGLDCRRDPRACEVQGDPYTSLPATSGPHWSTPANWGVYSTPLTESQVPHNLEHGGIVIWYDDDLPQDQVAELTQYVETQSSQGAGGRYKFILTPWGGDAELGAPIVVTAWLYLLELEEADTAAIDEFAREHYGRSPEPNGGPGPPAR